MAVTKMSEVTHVPGPRSRMKRHQLSIRLRHPENGVLIDSYLTAEGLDGISEVASKLQDHVQSMRSAGER